MRQFTLEELCSWWESEGTLALLPKGCIPGRTCNKAQFAVTQRKPIEFHMAIETHWCCIATSKEELAWSMMIE